MKKTILIISSVVLNISFILLFIFLQLDKTEQTDAKKQAINKYRDELSLSLTELKKELKILSSEIERTTDQEDIDVLQSKIDMVYQELRDANIQNYSKAEFYDNNNLKYKRIVEDGGKVAELYFFENGNIEKEKVYFNSKPYEEVVYYQNGNRKSYSRYEKDNLVNITTNHPNGQMESQGKKLRFNGKNDMYYGRWIWYNSDGTVRDEKNFN